MLDLSTIPVIDNHCHPVLRDQQMDALSFRGYFLLKSWKRWHLHASP